MGFCGFTGNCFCVGLVLGVVGCCFIGVFCLLGFTLFVAFEFGFVGLLFGLLRLVVRFGV